MSQRDKEVLIYRYREADKQTDEKRRHDMTKQHSEIKREDSNGKKRTEIDGTHSCVCPRV